MASAKQKEIRLSGLLKYSCIELDLKGKNKAQVIDELARLIYGSGKVKNMNALSGAMKGRERLGSTAILSGIAIPHARIAGVREPVLAFGRSHLGVDFSSLDGEKTYLFFVFVSPVDDVAGHLKILAKISHLVKDRFRAKLFKDATNKSQIVEIISDIEKDLSAIS